MMRDNFGANCLGVVERGFVRVNRWGDCRRRDFVGVERRSGERRERSMVGLGVLPRWWMKGGMMDWSDDDFGGMCRW